MRVACRPSVLAMLAPLVTVSAPGVATAQPGFYLTPSFSLAEVYDDNIFVTPSRRQADFITRLTPGIQAGYQSTPFTLLGRYAFDAEVFADHSELDDSQARQDAGLELRYLPDPTITLGLTGEFLQAQTAGELNLTTGLAGGRREARRYSVEPSLTTRFDPLTTGTADYAFAREESAGVRTDIHAATGGLERRLTPLDTGSFTYTFRHFVFDAGDRVSAHVVMPGWIRQLTPQTSLTLRAGPRFSEGDVDPEASASIRYKLEHGELSLGYARTQTTALGVRGSATTDGVTAGLTSELLPTLRIRIAPGFFRSTLGDSEAKVYQAQLEVTYRLTKWLAFGALYEFSRQEGALDSGPRLSGGEDQAIHRNVILVRLTATYPFRVY